MEAKRLGFIGIVINDRAIANDVNHILGQYSHIVRARIGIPDADSPSAVIGLIVEGDNVELGALTAKLGNLSGVEVKSALTRRKAVSHSENQ